MTSPLQIRLSSARAALDEQEWLTTKLKETCAEQRRLDDRVDALAAALKKEQDDVADLEGFSFQNVLQAIMGGKEAKLEKERAEAIAARLKHEATRTELVDIRQRISKLRQLIGALGDVQNDYDTILNEKREWLIGQGGDAGQEILRCAERQGHLTIKLREISEAIEAAQDAENIMSKMLGYLREASAWGWADIAGLPSDHSTKHGAIGAAHVDAVDARQALSRLQIGLKDVHLGDLNIEYPDGFLKFADGFLDSLAADIIVQSKICSSLDSVETTTAQVLGILEKLHPIQTSIREELVALDDRMTELLEGSS